MSGATTAIYVAAAVSAAAAATSYYQGQKQMGAQKSATKQAKAASDLTAKQQEEATNKANSRSPDVASLMYDNMENASGGQSGTMLTGAQGVDPASLSLGKSTLLGL